MVCLVLFRSVVERDECECSDNPVFSGVIRVAQAAFSGAGGGRLWRFKYHFPPRAPGNKEKLISLGTYPEVSLRQARERRDAARQDVANGIDPNLRRTCEKICLGATFEAVAREFSSVLRAANISAENPSLVVAGLIQQTLKPLHHRRPRSREPISARTVELMERRLEMHVFPYIGERDVQLLGAPELLEVLRRIESRGTYNLAHRVRSICSRVLRYARATGRKCEDVAADLVGILTPVESEHMAAIVEPVKIGGLLRSIEAYRGAASHGIRRRRDELARLPGVGFDAIERARLERPMDRNPTCPC
jgi:hypothetical protein